MFETVSSGSRRGLHSVVIFNIYKLLIYRDGRKIKANKHKTKQTDAAHRWLPNPLTFVLFQGLYSWIWSRRLYQGLLSRWWNRWWSQIRLKLKIEPMFWELCCSVTGASIQTSIHPSSHPTSQPAFSWAHFFFFPQSPQRWERSQLIQQEHLCSKHGHPYGQTQWKIWTLHQPDQSQGRWWREEQG